MQNGYVCGSIRSPASEHQNECNYPYLDRRCDHWFCCVCRRTCRELSVPSQETIENRCKACFGIDVNMKPVRFWYRIAFLPACRPSIDCARRVRPGYYEGAGPKPAAFVLCCSCALLVHRPAATDRRRSVNVGVEFGGSAHCPRRRCAEPSHCSWSSVATAGINYGNNGTLFRTGAAATLSNYLSLRSRADIENPPTLGSRRETAVRIWARSTFSAALHGLPVIAGCAF